MSGNGKATLALGLLGIGAGLAAGSLAATSSNARAAKGSGAAPATGTPVGVGGGGGAPVPAPAPTPAPAAGPVPAGPVWAPQPAVSAKTISQRVEALQKFLKVVQPYWLARPTECGKFAAALVMAAELEQYPLDLLIGHAWAEGALKPYMTPTKGSGAYGPVQVTAITCADVGMSYPPADTLTACRVGIRYMRKLRRYGAPDLTGALRMYGLGPGGYKQFMTEGCSGKPCSRPQSVWRHECGCSGSAQRYTWKVNGMAKRAASAGLHSRPWADWTGS